MKRRGRTNRMAPASAEYGLRERHGGTGRTCDERPQCSSRADARDGRTRTGGIGDAKVAVLQGEPADPVVRRASVNGLRGPARDEFRRPLLPSDRRLDALSPIGSRHVRQSAPAMNRTRSPQRGQRPRAKRRSHPACWPSHGAPSTSWVRLARRHFRRALCSPTAIGHVRSCAASDADSRAAGGRNHSPRRAPGPRAD